MSGHYTKSIKNTSKIDATSINNSSNIDAKTIKNHQTSVCTKPVEVNLDDSYIILLQLPNGNTITSMVTSKTQRHHLQNSTLSLPKLNGITSRVASKSKPSVPKFNDITSMVTSKTHSHHFQNSTPSIPNRCKIDQKSSNFDHLSDTKYDKLLQHILPRPWQAPGKTFQSNWSLKKCF